MKTNDNRIGFLALTLMFSLGASASCPKFKKAKFENCLVVYEASASDGFDEEWREASKFGTVKSFEITGISSKNKRIPLMSEAYEFRIEVPADEFSEGEVEGNQQSKSSPMILDAREIAKEILENPKRDELDGEMSDYFALTFKAGRKNFSKSFSDTSNFEQSILGSEIVDSCVDGVAYKTVKTVLQPGASINKQTLELFDEQISLSVTESELSLTFSRPVFIELGPDQPITQEILDSPKYLTMLKVSCFKKSRLEGEWALKIVQNP